MQGEAQATWKDHMKENQGPRLRSTASPAPPTPTAIHVSESTLELPAVPATRQTPRETEPCARPLQSQETVNCCSKPQRLGMVYHSVTDK